MNSDSLAPARINFGSCVECRLPKCFFRTKQMFGLLSNQTILELRHQKLRCKNECQTNFSFNEETKVWTATSSAVNSLSQSDSLVLVHVVLIWSPTSASAYKNWKSFAWLLRFVYFHQVCFVLGKRTLDVSITTFISLYILKKCLSFLNLCVVNRTKIEY